MWSSIYIRCNALPKKTLQVARQSKVGLIVQVKKNQEKLWKQCKEIVKEKRIDEEYEEESMSRNRLEKRRYRIYEYPSNKSWGKYIKVIIAVEREVDRVNRKEKKINKSKERAYYVSNFK
jgi:hypothetical protein